ncbi:hypothetical protein TNCV_4067031 [Trichonephila clavipes]|nr:hypothetical protein TNCV_4067031 [Trichonephila clavipes]
MEEGMGWGLPKQLGPLAFAVLVGDRKIRAERIEDASALFNVQVGPSEHEISDWVQWGELSHCRLIVFRSLATQRWKVRSPKEEMPRLLRLIGQDNPRRKWAWKRGLGRSEK